MASKHMKRFVTSLATMKCQSKSQGNMLYTKKNGNNKKKCKITSIVRDVEKLKAAYIVREEVKCAATLHNILDFLKKFCN